MGACLLGCEPLIREPVLSDLVEFLLVQAAGFTETNSCTTLQPGESCMISIKFKPLVKGTVSGTLTINDNATNTPQTITLSGIGT